MTSQFVRTVFDAARQLSADEQAELVDLLLTSSRPDAAWDAAWSDEAESRLGDFVRGEVQGEAADAAIAEGRRRLEAVRRGS